MLSERIQLQTSHIVLFHLDKMSVIDKSTETESKLVVARV